MPDQFLSNEHNSIEAEKREVEEICKVLAKHHGRFGYTAKKNGLIEFIVHYENQEACSQVLDELRGTKDTPGHLLNPSIITNTSLTFSLHTNLPPEIILIICEPYSHRVHPTK
ncbi:MAG: hypothetical protein EXS55_01810 [Candidatus Magasanikbacteria bacterium]|nr:hypothetical protein [Candidatus Magasanikbacteria bacterium]